MRLAGGIASGCARASNRPTSGSSRTRDACGCPPSRQPEAVTYPAMALRIGFDMDGVLADFSSAYLQVEERLYGRVRVKARAEDPEVEAGKQEEQEEGRERRSGDS